MSPKLCKIVTLLLQTTSAGVLQHPGAQFWGPQLVGVENFMLVSKGPTFGTAPRPALALMQPCKQLIGSDV